MLFSEPKIPQFVRRRPSRRCGRGFSALQRAENSSIVWGVVYDAGDPDCFSALQRAENSSIVPKRRAMCAGRDRFSALQRAENSSMRHRHFQSAEPHFRFSALQRAENSSIDNYPNIVVIRSAKFQCSSASRKFLNSAPARSRQRSQDHSFSALQRAENSSI